MARALTEYRTTVVGVLVSIIAGLISQLIADDSATSFIIALIGISISLGIEMVGRIDKLRPEDQVPTISVVSSERFRYQAEFLRMKETALKNLDLLGIANDHGMKDFLDNPSLLSNVFSGLRVRMMFLSPQSSAYIQQRAPEDGYTTKDLEDYLLKSVRKSANILGALNNRIARARGLGDLNSRELGSFEIRMFEGSPYCSIFRSDDRLLWGLYLSTTKGFNHAMLEVAEEEAALRTQLMDHFKNLWASSSQRFLVRYDQLLDEAVANAELFELLLGKDWRNAGD